MIDAVVFGSGLAGLSAAKRLALGGCKVAVVEKAPALGGHLLPFVRGGVTFEVGLHYIADVHEGSPFQMACARIGLTPRYVPLDERFEELRPGDCGSHVFLYEGTFPGFVASLASRFPTHARALSRYQRIVDLCWELSRSLEFPLRTIGILKAVCAKPKYAPLLRFAALSLDGALRRVFQFPRELHEILAAQHVLMGVDPRELSCLVHFLVHRYYFERACFVEGGGRELVRQLTQAPAGAEGYVQYFTSARTTLDRQGDGSFRVRGVAAQGVLDLQAREVVWTPDPRLLPAQAPRLDLPALLRARLAAARDPHALVVCYLATAAAAEDLDLPNRNVWLMGRLPSASAYEEHDIERLACDAPLYVSIGSRRDPMACPPDNRLRAKGVLQAMFLCPADARLWDVRDVPDGADYRTPESKGGSGRAYRIKKQRTLDLLVERLVRAFPALAGQIVWKELGTPLTHQRFLHSRSGSGYGFAATVQDFLVGRPSHDSGIPGLHLCGAHVKPAHGIVTALVNGVGLADVILKSHGGRARRMSL